MALGCSPVDTSLRLGNKPETIEINRELGCYIDRIAIVHSRSRYINRKLTSEPAPCLFILSRLQVKQNLWCGTLGHWTKWVSSRRSWHRVHLSIGADTCSAPVTWATAPSDDVVTVVDDTCLEPLLDLLPEGPANDSYTCNLLRFMPMWNSTWYW